jgi:hypothetical protein
MSKRELDLGRLAQKVGRRIEDEGQAVSQRFYEWERADRMPSGDSSRGGGSGGAAPADQLQEQKDDRQAARLRRRWLQAQVRLESVLAEMGWLMDQAKAVSPQLEKHRTPAQVEADGWCGSHWRQIGELVPVAERPTGEPYYRGKCLFCGRWPGGDPPAEVLRARREGRTIRVAAS